MSKSQATVLTYHTKAGAQPVHGSSPVPQDKTERERMREITREYVQTAGIIPPLRMEELEQHARAVGSSAGIGAEYHDFLLVMINNAAWQEYLMTIPCNRRTLLLPPCLRPRESCPAAFDEFGLLCEQCGGCIINELQAEAEQLGYAVLIAEGTSIVNTIVEKGMVDAVIGVSCLASLEAAFPTLAAKAIPGIAIPLLHDGCNKTSVDVDWVRQAMHLVSNHAHTTRMTISELRKDMQSWFTTEDLALMLKPVPGDTETISVDWLARGGKRWRPLLTVSIARALGNGQSAEQTAVIKKIALAVECFHKASLIHDDIEDNDAVRYGEETPHREYGMPRALNAGDLLVGEGYRLIGTSGARPEAIAQMLAIASEGHCTLCHGQGEELAWSARPQVLTAEQVLRIFALKTSPAFEVALRLGAVCAGADAGMHSILTAFSQSLGIAYQIEDDLQDFFAGGDTDDIRALRPSLLLALACERATGDARTRVKHAWFSAAIDKEQAQEIRHIAVQLGAEERARELRAFYRHKALEAVQDVRTIDVKILLYRLVYKILGPDPDKIPEA